MQATLTRGEKVLAVRSFSNLYNTMENVLSQLEMYVKQEGLNNGEAVHIKVTLYP